MTNPESFALVLILVLVRWCLVFVKIRDTVTGDVKTFGEICAIILLCIRNLLFLESPSPVYNGNYGV